MSTFFRLPECIQLCILINLSPQELALIVSVGKSMDVTCEKVAALAIRILTRKVFLLEATVLGESQKISNKLMFREMARSRITCFGGSFSEYSVQELCLNSGVWANDVVEECSAPRESFDAVHAQGFIYLISGADDRSVGTIERFNSITKCSTMCVPLPKRIRFSAATTDSNKLVVVGGEDAHTSLSSMAVYVAELEKLDESLGSHKSPWGLLDHSLLSPRKNHATALFHGKLWVAGGITRDTEISNSVETLILKSDFDELDTFPLDVSPPPSSTFSEGPSMINKRRNFKLLVVEDKLYAVGGDEESTIEVLDEPTNSWIVTTRFPKARQHFAATATGTCIYVIGGQDRRRASVKDMDCFDVESGDWMSSLLPRPISLHKSSSNKDIKDIKDKKDIKSAAGPLKPSPSLSAKSRAALTASASAPCLSSMSALPFAAAMSQGEATVLESCSPTSPISPPSGAVHLARFPVQKTALHRSYSSGFIFGQAVALEYGSLTW